MASKGKLRCGVIGTGMGRYHMEGYATHPKSELVAVCDLNFEEAKQFADKYGAKHVFRNYRDLIAMEELDIISVAVPNSQGIAVVCTNVPATPLVDELERSLGIPIFDSIAVTAWKCLEMVGVEPKLAGWGKLLRGETAEAAA